MLTSSVTSEICPSDATGWAYSDGSQDCSLEIKCGAETLYSVTSTDSSSDSSSIPAASPMPATISATPAGSINASFFEMSSHYHIVCF